MVVQGLGIAGTMRLMTPENKAPWLDNSLIGMVHVGALPGTPACCASLDEVVAAAVADAEVLNAGGCDAVLIENMHDVPYLRREVGPEIIAGMTAVGSAIRRRAASRHDDGAGGLGLQRTVLAGARHAGGGDRPGRGGAGRNRRGIGAADRGDCPGRRYRPEPAPASPGG